SPADSRVPETGATATEGASGLLSGIGRLPEPLLRRFAGGLQAQSLPEMTLRLLRFAPLQGEIPGIDIMGGVLRVLPYHVPDLLRAFLEPALHQQDLRELIPGSEVVRVDLQRPPRCGPGFVPPAAVHVRLRLQHIGIVAKRIELNR